MSIFSFEFLVFFLVVMVIYFCMPGKYQWVVLLCASLFYIIKGSTLLQIAIWAVYIAVNYAAALEIGACGTRKEKRKRRIFWTTVVLDVSALVICVDNQMIKGSLEKIFQGSVAWNLLAPLGMSYFALIVLGYVIEVYWGKYEPQKNIGKLALFSSFFPQMMSGPFVRYEDMSENFWGEQKRSFNLDNLTFGIQRILWGMFKKLVIAERCAVVVNTIHGDDTSYTGVYILLAVFLFVLQLYADFSGHMDIVLGMAEILGIRLPENFNLPFLSTNISEFWRRWHITLGAWAREYVFNPLLRTETWRNFRKWCKKKIGKDYEKKCNLPLFAGLFILWFLVGFWHGGSWKYIFGSGLFMWAVIVLGEILKPVFQWLIKTLRINTDCFSWRLFQRVRTFLIFSIGLSFFRAGSFRAGVRMWTECVPLNNWKILTDGSLLNLGLDWKDAVAGVFAVFVLLLVSVLQQKGSVRKQIASQNTLFRWGIWILLCVSVALFGMYGSGLSGSDFIYAGF